MAHRANKHPEHFHDLKLVVTMATAAELAGVDYYTIYHHVNNNNVAAIQDGKIWLISLRSLIELYPRLKPILNGYLQKTS